jgi:hypothetical protein
LPALLLLGFCSFCSSLLAALLLPLLLPLLLLLLLLDCFAGGDCGCIPH